MSDNDKVWLNVSAFTENPAAARAAGVFMDLVVYLWHPTMQPFEFDPERTAARLNRANPNRGYTPEKLREVEADLKTMLVQIPDGRWAPSPEYLSATDGNPGGRLT